MFRRQEKYEIEQKGRGMGEGDEQVEEDDARKNETPFLCNGYIFRVYGYQKEEHIYVERKPRLPWPEVCLVERGAPNSALGGLRGGLRGRLFGRAELREGRDRERPLIWQAVILWTGDEV